MKNEIIIYQADSHSERIEVTLENETVWLSLNQISTLFDRDKSVISKHLKNIFTEEELIKNSVVAFFAITASDGKTYQVEHYNLDAILSVGYRVNSKQERTANPFRIHPKTKRSVVGARGIRFDH
jgi:DNA ligase (NAD+)